MIISLFISSSQNFHHEQTQERVSKAKIGRFRSITKLCSMPAEAKQKQKKMQKWVCKWPVKSKNFHPEHTQQRVSDAKIGRFRSSTSMLCSMPAEQKRKRPETFFFLLFFGASACTISSWLPRSEPKRDRFGDLCEKKRNENKEGRKVLFNEKKV